MQKFIFLFVLNWCIFIFGQTNRKIVKDLDGDGVNDTIRIDDRAKTLLLFLSVNNFKKAESDAIEKLNFGNTLISTKKGFEFWNDFDRSGFRCVFHYNPKVKKMQLVQMRRIDDILRLEFGKKSFGKSSLNMLTCEYVGNFYEVIRGKLNKMKTINSKIIYPPVYLETFGDAICFDYEKNCLLLYEKNKVINR